MKSENSYIPVRPEKVTASFHHHHHSWQSLTVTLEGPSDAGRRRMTCPFYSWNCHSSLSAVLLRRKMTMKNSGSSWSLPSWSYYYSPSSRSSCHPAILRFAHTLWLSRPGCNSKEDFIDLSLFLKMWDCSGRGSCGDILTLWDRGGRGLSNMGDGGDITPLSPPTFPEPLCTLSGSKVEWSGEWTHQLKWDGNWTEIVCRRGQGLLRLGWIWSAAHSSWYRLMMINMMTGGVLRMYVCTQIWAREGF